MKQEQNETPSTAVDVLEVELSATNAQYTISFSTNPSNVKLIEFAPVVTWLHRLPHRPPYDKVSYSLCSTDGLIIRKGEKVRTGKFFSPNKRYSIEFVDSGAKIYDEAGGFIANEGGFFYVLGLEITDDGSVLVLDSAEVIERFKCCHYVGKPKFTETSIF